MAEEVKTIYTIEAQGIDKTFNGMEGLILELKKIGRTTEEIKNKMSATTKEVNGKVGTLSNTFFNLSNVMNVVGTAWGFLQSACSGATDAYEIQALAENKLATIMRQRTGATDEQIQSVKDLASAQQALGVIGDEVQLSGAQQLGTFVTETKTINTLIPAMNNLLAQQKGLKATSEDAVNIGNLMGKVLQGQTAALTRVGITFSEAQEKVLKYGNESERAAVLAQVITDNVGNMNQELANTPEGKVKQVENNMGDVQERIGDVINQIKAALAPALQSLVDDSNGLLDFLKNDLPTIASLIGRIAGILVKFAPIIASVTSAMVAYNVVTKAYATYTAIATTMTKGMTVAQLLLNGAMDANPVGAIVATIVLLIGLITTVVAKYKEWGAILGMVMGPLGMIVNLIMEFKDNWDMIKDSFKNGGFLEGLKAIGLTLRNAIIRPIYEMLNIIGAKTWAEKLKGLLYEAPESKKEQGGTASTTSQSGTGMGVTAPSTTTGNGKASKSATKDATKTIASGGTRNTSITISLQSLIHSITYNGTSRETGEKISQDVEMQLMRVLSSAESSL